MSTDPKDNIENELDENVHTEADDIELEAETLDLSDAVKAEEVDEETTEEAAEEAEESAEEAKTEDEVSDEAKTDDEVSDEATLSDAAKAGAGGGISASAKAIIVVAVIALLAGGLLFWKSKVAAHNAPMTKISKEDMEFLLKDANPQALKSLEDPEIKKKQIENLRQMLALANAARKSGLTDDEKIQSELEDIRIQLIAVNYDREINKDKGPMPPFGFIGEDRLNEFWGASQEQPSGFVSFLDKIKLGWIVGGADKRRREADFKKFFDTKIALAKESKQIAEDREPSEEEMKQAREYFAKTRIYAEEADAKRKDMSADFNRKINLSIGLQQAQYLSRLYAEKVLVEKTKVTDDDVQKYLSEHPELAVSPDIKAKAEEVLQRAKNGEDFAALAKEFSEDPGSKEKGGLYENTPQGQMVPEFEQAALALEPGQVSPNLVESKFGYHIIKLEKKGGEVKAGDGTVKQTYDARHILFLTGVKDPTNPLAQPMAPKDIAKAKLEEQKEKEALDEVVANNPVEVADDFTIPQVSQEQMQQMMQQQMQQQMPQSLDEGETPTTEKPKSKTTTVKPKTKK
jgi:parvulin-like peptidyl-prolyl isomerase